MAKNKAKTLSRLPEPPLPVWWKTRRSSWNICRVVNGRLSWNPMELHLPEMNRAYVLIGVDMTLWVSLQTILVLYKYSYSIVKAHYTQGNYSPTSHSMELPPLLNALYRVPSPSHHLFQAFLIAHLGGIMKQKGKHLKYGELSSDLNLSTNKPSRLEQGIIAHWRQNLYQNMFSNQPYVKPSEKKKKSLYYANLNSFIVH